MVSVKRAIDENPAKRKSFSEIFSGRGKLRLSDDFIETQVIGKGLYSKKDKETMDRIYDEYRKEIGLNPSKYLRDSFWHGVESGNYLVVMAKEKKSGKPLGFIRIVREKAKYGNHFSLQDYYTVPRARKLEIATKLGKKAYMIARMDDFKAVKSSHPVSRAGKFASGKVDRMQDEWAKIPQERFPKYDDYMRELREKHRKRFK